MTERETEMLRVMERLVTAVGLDCQRNPVTRPIEVIEAMEHADALLKKYPTVTLTLDVDEIAVLSEYWQQLSDGNRRQGPALVALATCPSCGKETP